MLDWSVGMWEGTSIAAREGEGVGEERGGGAGLERDREVILREGWESQLVAFIGDGIPEEGP